MSSYTRKLLANVYSKSEIRSKVFKGKFDPTEVSEIIQYIHSLMSALRKTFPKMTSPQYIEMSKFGFVRIIVGETSISNSNRLDILDLINDLSQVYVDSIAESLKEKEEQKMNSTILSTEELRLAKFITFCLCFKSCIELMCVCTNNVFF